MLSFLVHVCRCCPFFEPDRAYPTCGIRRQKGPPSQVGEFPHYTAEQIAMLPPGEHAPPAWCALREESVAVRLGRKAPNG